MVSVPPRRLGQCPRSLRRAPRLHTIHPTTLDNMATAARDEFEHTYDVYTDAWKLRLRC